MDPPRDEISATSLPLLASEGARVSSSIIFRKYSHGISTSHQYFHLPTEQLCFVSTALNQRDERC